MARIVCQVLHRADRITFIWSEGAAFFEPYHLEGTERAALHHLAHQIHARLALGSGPELPSLGQQLFRAIFPQQAGSVESWFSGLVHSKGIDRLEFLSDAPGMIPWAVLTDDPAAACFGGRFPLGASRRVNALRSNLAVVNPSRICFADPELARQLTGDAQESLTSLREAGRLVQASADLLNEIRKTPPDIVLVLANCHQGRLQVDGETFTIGQLRAWLDEPREGNPDPLVILLGVGDGSEQAGWSHILADASAYFSGLVANEALLPATQAFDVGSRLAREFMEGQKDVGSILQTLRQGSEAALAFGAFCPLGLRVVPAGSAEAPAPETTAATFPLPARPYRPFAAYDEADRALFIGREEDAIRAAAVMDRADAAAVFLHGGPAVGKTSFLQAGLLPNLESDSIGYRVLRDRSAPGALSERDYPVLVLRCTNDLAGQFADALSVFCAQPLTYATPTDSQVTVDLPKILRDAVQGATPSHGSSTAIQPAASPDGIAVGSPTDDEEDERPSAGVDVRELWVGLRDDEEKLGMVLAAITASLPFELIIAVDQGEELLTLARTAQQEARRDRALAMLTALARSAPRCKMVFTIRSQSLGELIGLLPDGAQPANWRSYSLRPLSEAEMVDALLWPTNRDEVPGSDEIPWQQYHFSFEDGLAQQIVSEAIEASGPEQQSALSLVQATAALLYERQVVDKKQDAVRAADLKEFGGVQAAPGKYLDLSLDRLNLSKHTRETLRSLIGKLYRSHADGSVSRDLVNAGDLKGLWSPNASSVETTVNRAAEEQKLFEIQQLFISGHQDLYISLPQDSLARLGHKIDAEKERNAYARTKVIDMLWIMIPLMFLAAAVSYWATRQYVGGGGDDMIPLKAAKETFEKLEKENLALKAGLERARRPQYAGLMAQANQALLAGNARRARELLLSQPAMLAYSEARGEGALPDLRGFEWRYLWRTLNAERFLLQRHQGLVNAIAVSPDSQWAASAAGDGTVCVWNLAKGEILALLTGPRSPVNAVAFAPDGKTLASAGADKLIRIWDLSQLKSDYVEIKKETKSLSGHTEAIHALTFGKDANTLASASADKSIIIWDVAKAAKTHTLSEHAAAVIALVSDGTTLFSGSADGTLIAWDLAAGKKQKHAKTRYQTLTALAISADGKTLCTGGSETKLDAELGIVRFWTAADLKESSTLVQAGPGVLSLALSSDGKSLATGGKDHVVRLWDVKTGKEERHWIGHLGGIRAVAISKDGASLLSGDYEGLVKVWNPAQSAGAEIIPAHGDGVQSLSLNRKTTLLASGARDGTVKLFDPKDGRMLLELAKLSGAVTAVALSNPKDKDKTLLAAASRDDKHDGEIKIWQLDQDAKQGWQAKLLHTLKHAKAVTCLDFHPDTHQASLLASGGVDHKVKMWDAETGKEKATIDKHKDEVRAVAFSQDGRSIVSGSKDGMLCVYDIDHKETDTVKDLHLGSIETIATMMLPAGDQRRLGVLTGGSDNTMRLFTLDKDEHGKLERVPQRTFRTHTQAVSAVLFNDRAFGRLVSAGWDGNIKICDLDQEYFTLTGHDGPVRAIVMAADQSLLVSAGNDGTIRFWRAAATERAAEKK